MTATSASVMPFAFEDHLVRVVMRDGEPWFVAKDVAAALLISWNGDTTLARIKAEWKGVVNFYTPGGEQQVLVISEPAVYKLAFRSNKPEAERFSDWVAGEVLPSIRKTGSYRVDDADGAPRTILPGHPDFAEAVRLVREARLSHSRAAALALWRAIGLPWVAELEEARGTSAVSALGAAMPDDPVARFALEGIKRAPGVSTPAAMLWPAFVTFCQSKDLPLVSQGSFATRFGRMGFAKRLYGGRSVFLNIRPHVPDTAGTAE